MSGIVSCTKLETELAFKQDKLTNCAGAPLVGAVPTCTEMNAAISAAVSAGTIPNAADVIPGIVALNLGTTLPADSINTTDALTAAGFNVVANDTSVTGGNPLQKAVTNAVQQSIGTDDGATQAIAAALAADPTAAASLVSAIPLASTTVPGLIEEATGEETRLGATDANKDDRAVTPGSMSYALQVGAVYPINVVGTATVPAIKGTAAGGGLAGKYAGGVDVTETGAAPQASLVAYNVNSATGSNGRAGYFGIANINAANNSLIAIGCKGDIVSGSTSGIQEVYAVSGDVIAEVLTDSGTSSHAVRGNHRSIGDGAKYGLSGISLGVGGGVNYGVYGVAANGATNWAGYFDGNVAAGPITTLSDATLKEDVQAIDPAKALQFRNGLRWVSYEMFSEQQVEITETVTDGKGNKTQVPTGRYAVNRNRLGRKAGLIAQEVQSLTNLIGAFGEVVTKVGEYFTLNKDGYPEKDKNGKVIVNDRLGLDYDFIGVIVMAGEQAIKTDPESGS